MSEPSEPPSRNWAGWASLICFGIAAIIFAILLYAGSRDEYEAAMVWVVLLFPVLGLAALGVIFAIVDRPVDTAVAPAVLMSLP